MLTITLGITFNIMLNTPQNKELGVSKMDGNFQLSVTQLTICKMDIIPFCLSAWRGIVKMDLKLLWTPTDGRASALKQDPRLINKLIKWVKMNMALCLKRVHNEDLIL